MQISWFSGGGCSGRSDRGEGEENVDGILTNENNNNKRKKRIIDCATIAKFQQKSQLVVAVIFHNIHINLYHINNFKQLALGMTFAFITIIITIIYMRYIKHSKPYCFTFGGNCRSVRRCVALAYTQMNDSCPDSLLVCWNERELLGKLAIENAILNMSNFIGMSIQMWSDIQIQINEIILCTQDPF